MLMTSSVAWAGGMGELIIGGNGELILGDAADADGSYAIAIGTGDNGKGANATGDYSIAIGSNSVVNNGDYSIAIGKDSNALGVNNIAIGTGAKVGVRNDEGYNSVALGNKAQSTGNNSVALGYGSIANSHNVVSVGHGGEGDVGPATRSIINVTDVPDWDAKTGENYIYGSYAVNVNTLNEAMSGYYTKAQADSTFVKISNNANDTPQEGFVIVKANNNTKVSVTGGGTYNSVVIDAKEGITVGEHSTRMDGSGFYVWAKNDNSNHNPDKAIASIKDDGTIKGADGAFAVDKDGNVTAKTVTADNLYTKEQVNELIGGGNAAVAGINQRLDKTNAKINKVGAGAAALAALHPLEYDPDDKLTFSAGMGNYAGENAAALGAFYRPNEKFMVSLGGTMGNGENMVNLGLSIGLDKPNGYAKLSKRELIQEVNAVKAENNMLVQKVDAVEAENEAIKAEMAEMKALLQKIMAKK